MKKSLSLQKLSIVSLLFVFVFAFQVSAQVINQDTVKSQKLDTGKMWTFEFPPFDYLEKTYGFKTTQEWFDDVRLSALRIPGCTASFVSEDGLIMTNNHCSRGTRRQVQKEGEDLASTAFFAPTLADERKVPNYTAEQLVMLKDVTKEVLSVLLNGKNEQEKISLRDEKMRELKDQYEKETKLKCDVISYYNGSLFFVQGFKTYTDVRLVFQPEEQIASYGGDPDNFTYPRYDLDCTFLRIYGDDGKPIKSDHYFKWSQNGAANGELVFTVGNPGSTNRLRTVAQLEYLRDIQYRNSAYLSDNIYNRLEQLKSVNPKNADEYERARLAFSNGWKSTVNTYKALNDPYLLARKKDFEKKLQKVVFNDPELNKQYGHVWKTIETTRNELRKIEPKLAGYSVNTQYFSRYLQIANAIVSYAKYQMLPEEKKKELEAQRQRAGGFGGGQRGGGNQQPGFRDNLYPDNFDSILEEAKLEINIDYITMNLGKNDVAVVKDFGNKAGKDVAKSLIAKSLFKDKAAVQELFKKTPEEILGIEDPFVQFYARSYDQLEPLRTQQKEIMDTENVAFGLLGQILYKTYGTSITPDANRTLRLSDGLMKGYDYNGTTAPIKSTFFGMYDRFYGFEGKYPFNLPDRWKTIPKDLDLSTPINFVATNDIVGGNSGSAVINKNAEVIGLAFDGNIESLQGNFIYLPTYNRTVAVDSKGIYEAIKKVYKFDRLADELKDGKMK
ncbi:MAG: S46 family peptidase [Ignavibacteriales bacterium]|nr:S46 family peptidase [Ignavibacteriales bacterium]